MSGVVFKGRTMVLQLLLPKSVDEIAFEVVRRVLQKRSVSALLAYFGIAFAQSIETLLFRGLYNQRVDVHRPGCSVNLDPDVWVECLLLRAWVQRHHGEGAVDQNVFVFGLLALLWCFGNLHSDL